MRAACRRRCSVRLGFCAITSRCCTTSITKRRDVARQLGLPLARAEAVNDDPLFVGTMADLVLQTWTRYQHGVPLTVAPTAPPERLEGPPLRRS